ncbi:terminase small subunit [Psychrobacillus sp. BM2]|uniref:terminase small subunit n=1 Tax=Psychrobacillus sp. BM2 TaxID=3400421 RepID=UPI003B022D9E
MEETNSVKNDLNELQRAFCEYYVSNGFNATQAAKSAGYSERTAGSQGSRLLKEDKIQKYIDILKQQAASHIDLSKEALLTKLNAMLLNSPEGIQLKAIDLINKMNGYYAPEKQEVTHNKYSDLEKKVEEMSAEELEVYIQSMNDDSDDKPNLKRVK